MSQYKPQKKHKANHGNYFSKPTKKDVSALNSLYQGIHDIVSETTVVAKAVTKKVGTQLKLEF